MDFLASSVKLIVEVDGGYHTASQLRLDAGRERKLRRAGYHVLRLSDELVRHQPQQAVARVREALLALLPPQ